MRGVALGRRYRSVRAALAAVALLPALLVSGCVPAPRAAPPGRQEAPTASAPMPAIIYEQVRSEHRQTDVRLYTAHPSGLERTKGLPVVLYLHGRDGIDPTPIPYDTLAALEREYRDGAIPAFAFVVVDGGYNAYWTDGSANGDLSSMLTEELPRWLRERGLGDDEGRPFAVAGISTGGFGALNYAIARQAAGNPVSAVAELAPALPVTWEHMSEKGVFGSEEQWRHADPLAHLDKLGDVPVGVWVGDTDPFLPGAERLVAEHTDIPVASVLPGGHDGSVFDVVGADMVRFLADHVPAAG
ncbi:S-formylglutathione hydrolase FrmB [Saccharopolyspora erythraea NRRL 2338]|nr:S-formylglutathione hydrolase FrmB [Saccharopolyspora erythraea NRRL 2338]